MPNNLTKQLKGKYLYLLSGVNLRWLEPRLLIIGLCTFIFAGDISCIHKSKPSVTDWPRIENKTMTIKPEIASSRR